MANTLELKDISTETLIKSRHRWQNAIVIHVAPWTGCSVCDEVHLWAEYALNKQISTIYKEDVVCPLCPLFKPGWCRSYAHESRLHEDYHNEDYETDQTIEPELAWERDVTEYLVWISIELVKRGVGVE